MRLVALVSLSVTAFAAAFGQQPAASVQTQADDYTRYELLGPGSGRFRIAYEVTATAEGATEFFNPIRKGSVASDEHVYDRFTGAPLPFDVVGGDIARAGGVRNADSTSQYIRVRLARPVPKDGEARILIDKTYYDPKSYYEENGLLVFARPLGIKRNAIVLPTDYEIVSCNVPSQVIDENGRLSVSFWNALPAEAPLVIKARRLPNPVTRANDVVQSASQPSGFVVARDAGGVSNAGERRVVPDERAHQNREIVYFLQ